jgi:hypothetical protein
MEPKRQTRTADSNTAGKKRNLPARSLNPDCDRLTADIYVLSCISRKSNHLSIYKFILGKFKKAPPQMKTVHILSVLFLVLISISCRENNPRNETGGTKNRAIPDTIQNEKSGQRSVSAIKYTIHVEKIDAIQFQDTPRKKDEELKIIADFRSAKKVLHGIVEFSEDDGSDENPAIEKINFRNGKIKKVKDFDGEYFIAYYPDEDILLCEGGHTTDVSYNLKNGKETEETGNPGLIVTSPKKEFRINGHYNGQECYSYFIQRKINGTYEKVIQLDEEFEKRVKNLAMHDKRCFLG